METRYLLRNATIIATAIYAAKRAGLLDRIWPQPGTQYEPANDTDPTTVTLGPTAELLSMSALPLLAYNTATSFVENLVTSAMNPYATETAQAERANGIPPNLLGKLLRLESDNFAPDVIAGQRLSRTGAVGIAQILPSTAAKPGYGVPPVNPRDPRASILFAARYLRAMYDRLHNWSMALAAYNQGLGTVQKAIAAHGSDWLAFVPFEGQKYVARINADTGNYIA